jgi:hypothetical protein
MDLFADGVLWMSVLAYGAWLCLQDALQSLRRSAA